MLVQPCLRPISFKHIHKTSIYIYKEDQISSYLYFLSPTPTLLVSMSRPTGGLNTMCTNHIFKHTKTQKVYKSLSRYIPLCHFPVYPLSPDPSSAFRIIKISHKYRTCKIGAFLMRVPDLCDKWE